MNRKLHKTQRQMERCFDFIAKNRLSTDPAVHERIRRRLKFLEQRKSWLRLLNFNHFKPD